MKLTLYYAPIAYSLVPYVTLTEAGAEFDVEPVNLDKGQQKSPEFLRLNPKHKVPVLVIDGEPLSENVAIQIWIARNFPKAELLPSDPMKEIKAISLMAWFASGIHPALTLNYVPSRFCELPGSEESIKRCAQKQLDENFKVADDLLADREWFFDHFTAVDAYFFAGFRRATQFDFANLDVWAFRNCTAHFERVQQRSSVQKLLAFEAKIQAQFAKET